MLRFYAQIQVGPLAVRCDLADCGFVQSAESLNALYVYEAKMSFLVRIASTKEGSEKLLEAQTLHKLAACSFIADRPKIEDAMGESFGVGDCKVLADVI